MDIRLEPQRSKTGRRKLVLLAALAAALLLGGALWFWARMPYPGSQEGDVEGLLRPGEAEFEEYRPHVTLEIQKSTLARNFAGNRMVMVSGTIHNGSDRLLEAVQLEISLRSADKLVAQQTRLVVSPGRTKPVAPQTDFPFTAWIEQVPDDWFGSADVQINGLKFSARTG
ncbi:MAG: hypothetical protein HYX74_10970 [Acidobacteria bacterium]|nr:hypothetical protein [Acidobacteriota bacterium]